MLGLIGKCCILVWYINILKGVKLFFLFFVLGYEQQNLVKKNKKRIFLVRIGNFFVILQPEK